MGDRDRAFGLWCATASRMLRTISYTYWYIHRQAPKPVWRSRLGWLCAAALLLRCSNHRRAHRNHVTAKRTTQPSQAYSPRRHTRPGNTTTTKTQQKSTIMHIILIVYICYTHTHISRAHIYAFIALGSCDGWNDNIATCSSTANIFFFRMRREAKRAKSPFQARKRI